MEAQQKTIDLKDKALVDAIKQNQDLTTQVQIVTDEKDAWYRNPYLWGLLGVVVGVAAVRH